MARSKATRLLLATPVVGALLAGTLAGCDQMENGDASAASPPGSASSTERPPAPVPRQAPTTCDLLVKSMTPRQRLAQLLVVGVNPANARAAVKVVSAEQVGGIFIGGNETGLLSDNALAGVQQVSAVPVSVAIDEEGGRVQRIDELDGSMPSAREMAKTMTVDQVKALGVTRGKAMGARGVTVDYGPDNDVSDEPADAVIGDRSFSNDPQTVRKYAMAFAKGLEEAGIEPVLKHFPGHGHASGDSHKGLVQTPPLAQLESGDLLPYQQISEFGPVSVMVGHLQVPGLTADEPASLSPAAYQLLRTKYAFKGPVITDDLGAMRAVSDRYELPDAVLLALQAGADQALWSSGDRVGEVLDKLEDAVKTGKLTDQRVHDSAVRVLSAKKACG
jgi:beta-N-acetylhexosaminidase